MYPTSDTLIQRPDLGAILYEAMEEAPTMGFIAGQVMPKFGVAEYSAEYPVIPLESLFELVDVDRAAEGNYNRVSDVFESGHYKTFERGLESRLDFRNIAIYSRLFDYETVTAKLLLDKLLRAQEARVAAKIFNTTNFTVHNVTTEWSNVASTPKADVRTAKDALRALGIIANALVINYTVFTNLCKVTEIVSDVTNIFSDAQKTGQVTIDHLKRVFDLEYIFVAGSLKNASKKGQDASLSDIWDDEYAQVCRVAEEGDDITNPCIGRTFTWNEGEAGDVIVEEYQTDERRSKILRVRHDIEEAFLASYDSSNAVKSAVSKSCGYLLGNITA